MKVEFNGIFGQMNIKEALSFAIENNRIGHAYVFSGSVGMGKRTIAKKFAGAMLCTSDETVPCGTCQSCLTFRAGTNPDFYMIDVAEDSIKIDEIRQMLSDVYIRPMYSNRKAYIISDADKMTTQAQNCLLKTLEEPPEFATIILTTSRYDALLETIRSRLSKIEFMPYSDQDTMQAVRNQYPNVEKIDFIRSFSAGNIGKALMVCENERFLFIRDKIFDIMIGMLNGNIDKSIELISVLEEGKEDSDWILDIIEMFLRDLLAITVDMRDNMRGCILINSDRRDIMISNSGKINPRKILNCIEHIDKIRTGITQNVNYSLAVEYLVMQLWDEIGK